MNFLKDNKGQQSSMRLMCASAFIVASVLAFLNAFGYATDSSTITAFLMCGFGGKVGQKFAEKE